MKKFPQNIFITGIDTDVGKTIVSAILAEALHADYWKPVQSGNTAGTDSELVRSLISNVRSKIHREAYSLKAATVPSYAAMLEGLTIEESKIILPETEHRLIIEGAGGLMVHLRRNFMIIDLIAYLRLPVILVSRNYLGSINHTLLSIEAMRRREIGISGIIYTGDSTQHMRDLIYESTGIPEIGSIDTAESVDRDFITDQAVKLRLSLEKHFATD